MKIWYQTMSPYRYDPDFDEYGKTIEEQCRRASRPGTEVYVEGVSVFMPEIDRFKSLMYYHTSQTVNQMLKAEKEGYDAFINGCSFDTAVDEGREMLSIPVVGIAHTNLHIAAMLGELFTIVTCEPYIAERYRQLIVRYGLQSKYLQGNYVFPIIEPDIARALKEPGPLAEKFKAVAEKAVADGASVIIPIPVHISQLFYKIGGLTNLNGALVLDPIAVAVKFAEMLVDLKKLGIEFSKTFQVYASPGRDLLMKAREMYAKVFKIEY